MQHAAIRRDTCRLCAGALVEPFLSLGYQPLANALCATKDEALHAPVYPLAVTRCSSCESVQLTHDVPADAMFGDYPYRTGASAFFRQHFDGLAETVTRLRFPDAEKVAFRTTAVEGSPRVLDIGCNDGTLLASFKRRGWLVVGVEPDKMLAAEAARECQAAGSVVEGYTVAAYWTEQVADQLLQSRYDHARWDVITACNVFAHVPDLHDFLRGVTKALKPGGLFVFEVYSLVSMLKAGDLTSIYHEHVYTHHLASLHRLLLPHGLFPIKVEDIPTHGGSLRVWATNAAQGGDGSVAAMLIRDNAAGVGAEATYADFAVRAQASVGKFITAVEDFVEQGARVIGYTAPAKATVLLHAAQLRNSEISYIVDDAKSKQGKFIPRLGIPIVGRERMEAEPPDVAVLFSWGLPVSEVASKLPKGCKLLIPLPELRIIEV